MNSSGTDNVLVDRAGSIAYVTLNRPDKLNALTSDMYASIRDAMDEVDDDDAVRVVVLRGNGRAFSAGYDINVVGAKSPYDKLRRVEKMANAARWRIWNLRKPVIAQIHGYCLGGACDLALPCDFLLASDDCLLGEPEIQFGELPAFLLVPWVVGLRRSKALLMTGTRITGQEAAELGLVTRSVPADRLENEVLSLAHRLEMIPASAMHVQKRGINRQYEAAGVKAGLDSWVDDAVMMGLLETEEISEFRKMVKDRGVKAALAWRDGRFAHKG